MDKLDINTGTHYLKDLSICPVGHHLHTFLDPVPCACSGRARQKTAYICSPKWQIHLCHFMSNWMFPFLPSPHLVGAGSSRVCSISQNPLVKSIVMIFVGFSQSVHRRFPEPSPISTSRTFHSLRCAQKLTKIYLALGRK